ncbi:MAG: diguanylate cyclase domain-containing protein [Anaerolineales bacterium]
MPPSCFRKTLEWQGFHCEVANNARDALHYLVTTVPELILLDMHLGGDISGQEILYQLRINPVFDNTRIVIVTAFPQIADFVSHLADLVLLKPIDVTQLKTLVQRITNLEYAPKHLLYIDPITGLYNQTFFETRLAHAFERARRRPEFLFGVILFSTKIANQTAEALSETEIHMLYKQIADIFRIIIRPTDTLTRTANWKFGLLMEELSQPADLGIIEDRLRASLQKEFQISAKTCLLQPIIASLTYTQQYLQPQQMFAAVEAALQAAEAEFASRIPPKIKTE